jgi:hypothetical protein
MPVGCWLNHFIIRKQSLIRAAAQIDSGDSDAASFINALLRRQHQDAHLIAVEDMGGDDGFVQRLANIGLRNSYSNDCSDFYSPYFGCARATWLEEASIKNVPDLNGKKSSTRWIAYRLIGDVSRNIVLGEIEGSRNLKPDLFPQYGQPVDPTMWPEEQWNLYPLDHPMRRQWLPGQS